MFRERNAKMEGEKNVWQQTAFSEKYETSTKFLASLASLHENAA